jgi:hypothetical protein
MDMSIGRVVTKFVKEISKAVKNDYFTIFFSACVMILVASSAVLGNHNSVSHTTILCVLALSFVSSYIAQKKQIAGLIALLVCAVLSALLGTINPV